MDGVADFCDMIKESNVSFLSLYQLVFAHVVIGAMMSSLLTLGLRRGILHWLDPSFTLAVLRNAAETCCCLPLKSSFWLSRRYPMHACSSFTSSVTVEHQFLMANDTPTTINLLDIHADGDGWLSDSLRFWTSILPFQYLLFGRRRRLPTASVACPRWHSATDLRNHKETTLQTECANQSMQLF